MAQLRWSDPAWLSDVHAWITARLESHGYHSSGGWTQPHLRPWSTAIRIPTSSRDLWFKAGTLALAHEAALTPFLAALLPEHSPRVIATEPSEGWMLMEDVGTHLRSRINSVTDLHWWHRVVEIYTDLQKLSAKNLDGLVATRVIDRRLPALEDQWEDLLADTGSLMVGKPDGLAAEQLDAATRLWPRIEDLFAQADQAGLPYTVVHEDLHDNNVFVKDEDIIIADWGDSSIANPLTTLTVLLNSAAHHRELEVTAPEIKEIRTRYLACWSDYCPPALLESSADAAIRIGMLHRALTWRNAIQSAPEEHTAEWADAVPAWLGEFLGTFDE